MHIKQHTITVKSMFGYNLDSTHPAKARILLKKNKAHVISTLPFIIKLNYPIKREEYYKNKIKNKSIQK